MLHVFMYILNDRPLLNTVCWSLIDGNLDFLFLC
jgi:hypothetical protein